MVKEYTGNEISCIVKLNRTIFDKGNFKIISMKLIKNLTETKIELDRNDCISLLGYTSLPLREEEEYIVFASEVRDDKYGLQYNITDIKTNYPLESRLDIEIFLKEIMTELQFKNYSKAFKKDLLKPLKDGDVELIVEKVKGMGADRAVKLIQRYNNNSTDAYMMVRLKKFELTKNDLEKLRKVYGNLEEAYKAITENPYKLIRDVKGYGFKKADSIATTGGMHIHDFRRGQGFIEAYLYQEANTGSTRISVDDLCDCLYNELGEDYPDKSLVKGLQSLEKEGIMWVSKNRDMVGLNYYRDMEKELAKKLYNMINCKTNFSYVGWENRIKMLEKEQGWQYTNGQKEAIKKGLESNVSFIIGSGGVGKTAVVSGIRRGLGEGYFYLQTALSGKACENLQFSTRESSMTIHKFLNGIQRAKDYGDEPLIPDVVILDEISMCGIDILHKLILELRDDTKLIFLGDKKQLASIGVGNFLVDCMNSEKIPIIELTEIHRQAQGSGIITESIKVSNGEQLAKPSFLGTETRGQLQDFVLDVYNDKSESVKKIIGKYKELLDKGIGYEDIQVVVPMNSRGLISSFNLSNRIQELIFDKKTPCVEKGTGNNKYKLHVGDLVMNIANNYNTVSPDGEYKPIMNGDIAKIIELREDGDIVIESRTKGKILIPCKNTISLKLSYACTAHKLQGSSAPYVIIGLDYSAYMMLCKEWLYTAITRAKKKCYLFAENSALRRAINTSGVTERSTFLKEFLVTAFKTES